MKQQNFTPRGLTQNWNFIEENSKAKKGRKGGPFVSQKEKEQGAVIRKTIRETPRERADAGEDQDFHVQVKSNGDRYYQPRKGGKFQKQVVISATLAEKLGL